MLDFHRIYYGTKGVLHITINYFIVAIILMPWTAFSLYTHSLIRQTQPSVSSEPYG